MCERQQFDLRRKAPFVGQHGIQRISTIRTVWMVFIFCSFQKHCVDIHALDRHDCFFLLPVHSGKLFESHCAAFMKNANNRVSSHNVKQQNGVCLVFFFFLSFYTSFFPHIILIKTFHDQSLRFNVVFFRTNRKNLCEILYSMWLHWCFSAQIKIEH